MGENRKDALRVNFDRKLKLEFHGTKVTRDTGKRLNAFNSKVILILSSDWKAWLRSKAFNMGNSR